MLQNVIAEQQGVHGPKIFDESFSSNIEQHSYVVAPKIKKFESLLLQYKINVNESKCFQEMAAFFRKYNLGLE